MTKKDLKKVIDKLEKLREISEKAKGRTLKLFQPEFQEAFIDALELYGDNGQKVYEHLIRRKHDISIEQVQEYVRRLFGGYSKRGRPPKYLKTEHRQMI